MSLSNLIPSDIYKDIFFFILNVLLVTFLIEGLRRRNERKTWDETRARMANVLLASMSRTMTYIGFFLAIRPDARIALNTDIELHAMKAEVALGNFNEQMIVHIPAFLPPISQNLSELSNRITALEEAMSALRFHLFRLSGAIRPYDASNPTLGLINPQNFYKDEQNRTHLSKSATRTDTNYLVLALLETFQRLGRIVDYVEQIVAAYASHKEGGTTQNERDLKIAHLRKTLGAAMEADVEISTNGLYLAFYTPVDTTLQENQ